MKYQYIFFETGREVPRRPRFYHVRFSRGLLQAPRSRPRGDRRISGFELSGKLNIQYAENRRDISSDMMKLDKTRHGRCQNNT